MSARIQNALRMIGKQIHDLRFPQMPTLSSNQQTRLTWARIIASYESLPEEYREAFNSLPLGRREFPYTVVTPAYETFTSRISAKLICASDREIYVLERNGKGMVTQCYPLEAISYVEISSMLLDYRFRISGLTSQGVPASSLARCSTATDYLFTPILRKIRLHGVPSKGMVQTADVQQFDAWSDPNYKFMNFARKSILEGEKVLCAILQPEVTAPRFRALGRTFHKTISPTHVCILTDRELIMIREETLQDRKDKYGGIWEYVPLNKIAALSISKREDDLLALSAQLFSGERFECLFQASQESDVAQLSSRFHELTSR